MDRNTFLLSFVLTVASSSLGNYVSGQEIDWDAASGAQRLPKIIDAQLEKAADRQIQDLKELEDKIETIKKTAANGLNELLPIYADDIKRLADRAIERIKIAQHDSSDQEVRDELANAKRIWIENDWSIKSCEYLMGLDKELLAAQYEKMLLAKDAAKALEKGAEIEDLANKHLIAAIAVQPDRNDSPELSTWRILVYITPERQNEFAPRSLPKKFRGFNVSAVYTIHAQL